MNAMNGRRTPAWRMPSVSANGLKNFACVVMLLQTIGTAVIQNGMIHLEQYTQEQLSEALAADSGLMFQAGVASTLQLIGCLAIPIFVFLLVEGFLYTSDYRKYLLAVLITAVISEIPYDLAISLKFWDTTSQNAMMSMLVSLLMLYFLKMAKSKAGVSRAALQILIVLAAVLWVTILRAEYGLCVVLLAAVFYIFHERSGWKMLLGILISLMYVTCPLAFYGIWCYNGKREDKIPKYAYYVFYPLHLLILGGIACFL